MVRRFAYASGPESNTSGSTATGGRIIQTVKYADDLMLMAKEEKVLQGMIDKLI